MKKILWIFILLLFMLTGCTYNEYFEFGATLQITRHSESIQFIKTGKGMIVANDTSFKLELYDLEHNLVSQSLGITERSANADLYCFLPVEEAGTYYLHIKNIASHDEEVKIDFYEYDTVVDKLGIDISTVSMIEGTIEGKYDFQKYIYNNPDDKEHTLQIENLGEDTIIIYSKKDGTTKDYEYVRSNQTAYYKLDKGYNEIFICQEFTEIREIYEYSYKANIKILPFYIGINIIEDDIPETFKLLKGRKYHTYLEKGVYSIMNQTNINNDPKVSVYDEEGKYGYLNAVEPYSHVEDFTTHFTIPEDGWYFVSISQRNNYDGDEMKFTKHDYKTIPDRRNPILIDASEEVTITGTLEGIHDYEYYHIVNNSNERKIYYIINETDQQLKMIHKVKPNTQLDYEVKIPHLYDYIACDPGETEIIVFHNFKSQTDTPYEYSFRIKELENNNITDPNTEEIKELTKEYSDEFYLAGYDINPTYMKLTLKERGVVNFVFKNLNDFEYDRLFQAYVYGTNQEIYYTLLEAGTYYIKFALNDNSFNYAQIKYNVKPINDTDVFVTLKELDETNNDGKFSEIYSQKYHKEHIVKYHFTLEEKSTLYYTNSDILIYDKNNVLQMFPEPKPWGWPGVVFYVNLEAGSYYFMISGESGVTTSGNLNIHIGIKTIERDAPLDLSNMQKITIGKTKTTKVDNFQDVDHFEFTIEEAGEYQIYTQPSYYVYNELKELIGDYTQKYDTFELPEGKYYLVVYSCESNQKTNNVIITKID